jgi:hypothetical protein
MKLESFREGTRVFDLPLPDHIYFGPFFKQLLGDYKLVVAMGMPCTGKTTSLQSYQSDDGCVTIWNRQHVFDMLFIGGERDEKYNSHIQAFEARAFPSLLERPHHQVFVDGWHRLPSSRKKLLGYLEQGAGKTCAICFDGPSDQIVARMTEDSRYEHLAPFEIKEMVSRFKETTVWPTFSEGFDDIYWLNTFGEDGSNVLKSLVVKRDR